MEVSSVLGRVLLIIVTCHNGTRARLGLYPGSDQGVYHSIRLVLRFKMWVTSGRRERPARSCSMYHRNCALLKLDHQLLCILQQVSKVSGPKRTSSDGVEVPSIETPFSRMQNGSKSLLERKVGSGRGCSIMTRVRQCVQDKPAASSHLSVY
jgi:hypothetical protein